MNISDIGLKVKTCIERCKTREVYTAMLIILVGFTSFGLGRLSKLREAQSPVSVEEASSESVAAAVVSSIGNGGGEQTMAHGGSPPSEGPRQAGKLVASKGGSKYHFPWCSGAQRIAEANKIWFNSVEEARKAGYTPASNCKGLK